ncbi:uncharacterized protein LOC129592676 [Paramacrobiotus metropolitanus]|uniref:uncharacterized protein LOC129592676 n=1 Tax=Paramacrobiotus metropolitanus TaxID=2943436 RepID=UPI002445E02A|nr:uncharacterized protein LOC129592676 [Paramacrobiotus metropolitanus]
MNSSLFNQPLTDVVTLLCNSTLASVVTIKQKADTDQWRQTVSGSGNWTKNQIYQAYIFEAVSYPILLVLCTIGNGLNLVVLISEKRKTSMNCYMTAEAIADLVLLWSMLPQFIWNTSVNFKLPYKNPGNKAIVAMVVPYVVWIRETFLHLCDWVLIVFSLERLLAITQPFSTKRLQAAATARLIIVALFFFSSVFSVCNFVTGWYNWKYSQTPGWLQNWSDVQDVAEVVVMFIKFFGSLIINLLVIAAIRRAAIRRQHLFVTGQQRAAQTGGHEWRYRNSNYLLIGSACLYLFTMLPSLVYKILIIAETNHLYNFDKSAKLSPRPFAKRPFGQLFYQFLSVFNRQRKI